jgi:hypothetical protein
MDKRGMILLEILTRNLTKTMSDCSNTIGTIILKSLNPSVTTNLPSMWNICTFNNLSIHFYHAYLQTQHSGCPLKLVLPAHCISKSRWSRIILNSTQGSQSIMFLIHECHESKVSIFIIFNVGVKCRIWIIKCS